jgi:SAM-dependent methyltransferase
MATAKFDPIKYKETTKNQWDTAAEAWHRWGPLLNRWLGEATEEMLDMANIHQGSNVLDVAAGAGEQSITVAKRIGANGRILATDISSEILEYARSSAILAGIPNLETKVIDGELLDTLGESCFDAVISRVGLIYFPDQQKALQGMKSCLRPGGKISVMTYAAADRNDFFSIPVAIIRRRAQLPPPLPGQPGPFSLGDPEVLKKTLEDAGFKQVEVKAINAPVRLTSSLECIQFEQESFGALHQMLSGLSPAEQDEAWEEIEQALEKFEENGQFNGPCEMLIASAIK